MRRLSILSVVLLAIGVALVLSATPASAHAALAQAEPPAGSSLAKAPAVLVLNFTETVDPRVSVVRVLDEAGKPVEVGPTETVSGRPASLRVSLPQDLPEGTYTVNWRNLSRTDGHVLAGAYALGVGVPASSQQSQGALTKASGVTAGAVISRAGFYLGLVALVGGAIVAVFLVPAAASVLLRFGALAWVIALIGAVGVTQVQRANAGVAWGDMLSTSLGDSFLWRVLPLVISGNVLLVALLTKGRVRTIAFAVAGCAALVAMAGDVVSGHAAARTAKWLNGALQWLHFAAATVWIGGLAALLLALRAPRERASEAVRRYSTVAAISLPVVAVTGVVRALNEVGGWSDLFSTGFGRIVLLKASLFLALGVLGAVNRFRNVPMVARSLRGLRRVGTAEVGLAAIVIVATAFLVNLVPGASSTSAAAGPRPLRVEGADFGTTTRVVLQVEPGAVGPNRFFARVTDYDTGDAVVLDRIILRFNSLDQPEVERSSLELPQTSPGRFATDGTNLSIAGRWNVQALVPRGAEAVEVPLQLRTRTPVQRIRESKTPGLPTIYSADLAGGNEVQVYLDPGRPGQNELHVTFFNAQEKERRAEKLTVAVTTPDGKRADLPVQRLTPGHFSADVDVTKGRWRYAISALLSGARVSAEVPISVG